MRLLLAGAALLLAGCSAAGMMAAVIVVGTEIETGGDSSQNLAKPRPPDMAAERKVSEQDCTQPIDHTLGNIRCK